MTKNKDEFRIIADIMSRHGGTVAAHPQNRGLTNGGYLVHVIKMEGNPKEIIGVTNSHGPGITWDFIYMESVNGGLNPTQYPKQAFYIQERANEGYTFRGLYQVDSGSTEKKIIFRRIDTKINEEDDEWKIRRFV
jgi:hypothetical protein